MIQNDAAMLPEGAEFHESKLFASGAGKAEIGRGGLMNEESSAPPALRAEQREKERMVIPEEDTSGF